MAEQTATTNTQPTATPAEVQSPESEGMQPLNVNVLVPKLTTI
jgi:hypothetical protein